MKKIRHFVVIVAITCTAAVQILAGSAVKRLSTAADGSEGVAIGCNRAGGETRCNGRSRFQSSSADGRYVAFVAAADNLVPNDTNDTSDIFVKDRITGAIVRASTTSTGGQANEASTAGFTGSHHPSISANGRFVAFESYASNLVPGDTNDQPDVFVKDLQTGALVRAGFNGAQGDYAQWAPILSADGRYIAFISTSTTLYPDFGSTIRAYRFDIQTGSTVTVAGGQTTINDRDFDVNPGAALAISSDGRYVTFGGKEIGFTWWRVIRRDLVDRTLAVASVSNGGNSANGHSAQANTLFESQNIDMTPDGRYVVFTSDATNLDPGDNDTNRDVYLRDFQTSTTTLITKSPSGQTLGNISYNVSISADARFVAFEMFIAATGKTDMFLADRTLDRIHEAPYTPNSGGSLLHPSISDNGRFLSFSSSRGDLVPNDMNSGAGIADVFSIDLLSAESHRNHADFDGDSLADISVFRPSDGNWYWLRSSNGQFNVAHWGANGDIPVAADLDGDARTDLVVFRPSNGVWYILNSSTGTLSIQQFGQNGDKPVAADYDGDERADIAVFRPADAVWYIAHSSGGPRFQQWGLSTDRPVVGDFDGDGRSDLGVFRPSNGVWYMMESPSGAFRAIQFGANSDRPVAADYNGDGITDLAVFRPSSGIWYFNLSHRFLPQVNPPLRYDFAALQWGIAQDLPVPADFDGDGRADPSVFRTTNGVWYVSQSSIGTRIQQFGVSTDVPPTFAAESN
jgi:Tol biopolymer transport system component